MELRSKMGFSAGHVSLKWMGRPFIQDFKPAPIKSSLARFPICPRLYACPHYLHILGSDKKKTEVLCLTQGSNKKLSGTLWKVTLKQIHVVQTGWIWNLARLMKIWSRMNSLHLLQFRIYYRNVPKFSDRQVQANSADPDQTAPQGLHYLPFRLHHLDSLLYGRAT